MCVCVGGVGVCGDVGVQMCGCVQVPYSENDR